MKIILILLGLFLVAPYGANAGMITKAPVYLGLSTGLVGCWTFDGAYTKAPDCSGNNNTGTLTNGPTKVQGKIGQALSFDGSDDYVDIGTGPASVNTVAFWVYSETTTEYLVNLTGTTDFIWVNAGTITATGLTSPAIYVDGAVSSTLAANRWQYVVVTTATSENASNLDIARTEDANYLQGKIDDVRIYNRALSAGEIQRLYRIGLGSTANRSNTDSLKQGLVGYWTFDGGDTSWTSATAGTTRDRSGNNNTGTLGSMNQATAPVQGKIGQALSFEGGSSNDSVDAGSGSSLDDIQSQGGGGMSVAFWAKVDSNAFSVLISKGGGTAGWQIQKNFSTNPARVVFRHEGTTDLLKTWNNILTTGEWVHVVITWDGATLASGNNLYRNGVLITGVTGSSTDGNTLDLDASYPLCIGGGGTANCLINEADTDLDDVRIYNRVLSVGEIQRLYRIGLGSTANRSNTDSLKQGLVGCWTFDGAYTQAPDCSGNNNTGTLTNGPTKVAGKIGQGLSFDGSNDYVNTPAGASMGNIWDGGGTASFWIYLRSAGEGNAGFWLDKSSYWVIFSNSSETTSTATGMEFWVQWSGSTGGSAKWRNFGTSQLKFNQWNHVVIVYDSDSTANDPTAYINGVAYAPSNETIAPVGTRVSDAAQTLQIGSNTATSRAHNGLLDDVRIYNRALSANEILRLYNMGK